MDVDVMVHTPPAPLELPPTNPKTIRVRKVFQCCRPYPLEAAAVEEHLGLVGTRYVGVISTPDRTPLLYGLENDLSHEQLNARDISPLKKLNMVQRCLEINCAK